MIKLDWETLKSRDSKCIDRYLLNRNEIELWNGYGEYHERGPYISSFPISKCPENAVRCLHFGASFTKNDGLRCPDCKQRFFFGTFDAIRWVVREWKLGRKNPDLLSLLGKDLLQHEICFILSDFLTKEINNDRIYRVH